MSRMRSSGLALAVTWCAASVHADPLAVTTTGALPFSRVELEVALALRARLATPTTARRIEARVAGDDHGVRIDVVGRVRTVTLDGEQGADAARLVAFAILDIVGDQLDPPAVRSVDAERSVTVAPVEEPGWSIAMWGVTGSRSFGALEVGAPIARRLRVVASAGVGLATTETAMTRTIAVRAFPARVGLAARLGRLELRASAIAIAEHASAARTSTDVIVGGGVATVYALPIASGFALLAGGGVDGFATALDYRVDGIPVATTERIAWWAGAAIARETRW